jgi:hypothetical protein
MKSKQELKKEIKQLTREIKINIIIDLEKSKETIKAKQTIKKLKKILKYLYE